MAASPLAYGVLRQAQQAASGIRISKQAVDFGQTRMHVHVDGAEIALRPGANGSVSLSKVFSSTNDKVAEAAMKRVSTALQDPAFRKQIYDAAARNVELLKHGNAMERARAGELSFLMRALEKWGLP